MTFKRACLVASLSAFAIAPFAAPFAAAEEGMWTFDNFPAQAVKDAYGWAPDAAWLDRIRTHSVRLDSGCSGSVISGQGLVLTNHHCVNACIANLSTPEADYMTDGFLAATKEDEKICPGVEISILQDISDVTSTIQGVTKGLSPDAAKAKRDAEIARVEEACAGDNPAVRCEVVSLYRGGQYKLYKYDRYSDVRLAFAPELQAGFFGGDPDNFNFPRYAYDMAFLRLYKDGAPVRFDDWLRFDADGAEEGDLVFISGHPGSTNRLNTIAQLAFWRDTYLPFRLVYLSELRGRMFGYAARGEEQACQAESPLFGIENSFKAFTGRRAALADPAFFGQKVEEEAMLRAALAADPALQERFGDPWAEIEAVQAAQGRTWAAEELLEIRAGAGSRLYGFAASLLRAADERAKPAADRLPEFAPARLASFEQNILSARPVYPGLEIEQMVFWLEKTREYLGPDHPAVLAIFGAKSARQIAEETVSGSTLADPAVRKALWDGGKAAVDASTDPMIALARAVDPFARAARKADEDQVSGIVAAAAEKIAGVRFAVLGDSTYPDATFTLRLSYGAVEGWDDPAKGEVTPFTYTSGLWKRATGAVPFNLAPRWAAAQAALKPDTQFNLVSTNDIIGGNSGSPLISTEGKIVGLVFDGNIHSLGGAYGFDARLNRTVSVASPIMLEALTTVYGAAHLADEINAD
jgi:hypothetical protein